jgi:hydrogenase/urease accessory protein HupE
MIRFWWRAICLIGLLMPMLPAQAHPLAPALLDLREVAPARYAVLWRTSIARAEGVGVEPSLPADCATVESAQSALDDSQALVVRWVVQCGAGGLVGKTLTISGLERSGINVIVHLRNLGGEVTQGLLSVDQPSFAVPAPQAASSLFRAYVQLGIGHLLTGFDHMLFLLGLLLLVRRLRPLLITITAFTLGHSVTLSLATLGLVHVKQPIAELGIAISILVLAAEVARPAGRAPTVLARKPWLMAFSFGLLHGLGFAGALAEIGLPQNEIPLSLLSFNVGIESGQILIVALALLTAVLWRSVQQHIPIRVHAMTRAFPPYVIGSLAALWCFQRAAIAFL